MSFNENNPVVLTTHSEIADVCSRFADAPFVTVDTEFLRENTFWSKLCLIQIATSEEAFIIDPLAQGIDLTPFFELMKAPSVVKVFHAARQDVEIFVQMAGTVPSPMFDTQIAAMVCGFGDQVSYDFLARKIAGTGIDKTSRFTDWSRRPLSDKQLAYALSDVTYLRDVYVHLDEMLRDKGRSHWVAEEMAVLTDLETYQSPPENAWKRLKVRVKKPRQLAVMQALASWREEEAQSRNVPRGRVIKDDTIYEIAQQQPRSREALARLRSMPRGFERSGSAAGILDAVERAMVIPENDLPTLPRPRSSPEHAGATVELLKVLLKMTAEENAVASRIIATIDELEKIAGSDTADVPALKGWRRELFGDQALALKRGEIALSLGRDGVVTFPTPRLMAAE